MDILMVPIPLFSKEIAVEAYYFRYQKGNDLMHEAKAAGIFDGAMNSPLLETLKLVGIEPFAMDKPIFVPVSAMMLLGDLPRQSPKPYEKLIFLLGEDIAATDDYLVKIRSLKELGFRFAMYKIDNLSIFGPILSECEYLFLDQKTAAADITPWNLPQNLNHLKLVATHIDHSEDFQRLSSKNYALFEGRFYRIPITKGQAHVAPLKVNLVRLLNVTQDDGFDFRDITAIIERDPSLSASLLKIVNSPYISASGKIKTIGHAVAMLGEEDVRKWISTSVARLLGSDRPDEITKLSLIRAKFAENLASLMHMDSQKQSLFLTGLFSVLGIILEMPLKDALAMVRVDDDIYDALVAQSGPFNPVLQFIFAYERSDWNSVSRILILNDLSPSNIYDAYINANLWYRDLIDESAETVEESENHENSGEDTDASE